MDRPDKPGDDIKVNEKGTCRSAAEKLTKGGCKLQNRSMSVAEMHVLSGAEVPIFFDFYQNVQLK